MASVYVKTLGCKVNTFDSHAIENQFRRRGWSVTDKADGADVTVINSCSVTSSAEKEARYLLRRYRRENPDSTLIVTGCYAQTNSGRLVEMPEVDLVIPNEIKDNLVEVVERRRAPQLADGHVQTGPASKLPTEVSAVTDNRQGHFKSSITLFDSAASSQTRAFVKIQDGCNGFCAYCLIPYARGASRSVPRQQVLDECSRLIAQGVQEIVLTGIHVGDYGEDFPNSNADGAHPFAGLVAEILALPGLGRIRISSLEPNEVSEELLKVLAANPGKVCDHFHLPLQSGCDSVLKRMRRTYKASEYAERVARIRHFFPLASIGADVIPGFPGETDEEFDATVAFIESIGLSYLHVFPYSSRPNTTAARMPGHLPADVIKARAARLRKSSTTLLDQYSRKFLGAHVRVLWESDVDGQGRRMGTARNYLKVTASRHAAAVTGKEVTVLLKGFVDDGRMLGQPISG